jgi:hypothetical protein
MMISDVLSEAVTAIDDYLADPAVARAYADEMAAILENVCHDRRLECARDTVGESFTFDLCPKSRWLARSRRRDRAEHRSHRHDDQGDLHA